MTPKQSGAVTMTEGAGLRLLGLKQPARRRHTLVCRYGTEHQLNSQNSICPLQRRVFHETTGMYLFYVPGLVLLGNTE